MVFWLNEYHIDGWRLDVADEIDPSLWTRIRYRIKSAYPDCLLLGETWGDGFSLLDEKSVDSIMNYVFRDSVRDFLARGSIDAKMLTTEFARCVRIIRKKSGKRFSSRWTVMIQNDFYGIAAVIFAV